MSIAVFFGMKISSLRSEVVVAGRRIGRYLYCD